MAENELDLRLAVLIDADNASRTAMKDVMAEVAVYGTPTIKRIYGHSFSKHSCNNIMDGFMREAYRMKKAFLYLTTPWEK